MCHQAFTSVPFTHCSLTTLPSTSIQVRLVEDVLDDAYKSQAVRAAMQHKLRDPVIFVLNPDKTRVSPCQTCLQLPPLKYTDVLISHCFRYEGNLSSASCWNRVLILAALCTGTRLLQRHHSAGRSHKLGSRVAATSYVYHSVVLATAQPLTHTHTHTGIGCHRWALPAWCCWCWRGNSCSRLLAKSRQ